VITSSISTGVMAACATPLVGMGWFRFHDRPWRFDPLVRRRVRNQYEAFDLGPPYAAFRIVRAA